MKATRNTIPTLIEKREEFSNTSGTLRGIKNPSLVTDFGQLDQAETDRLRIDQNTTGLAYLVVSYNTPIAWETKTGHVYKVEQRFTQTTSKHQGMLYQMHSRE